MLWPNCDQPLQECTRWGGVQGKNLSSPCIPPPISSSCRGWPQVVFLPHPPSPQRMRRRQGQGPLPPSPPTYTQVKGTDQLQRDVHAEVSQEYAQQLCFSGAAGDPMPYCTTYCHPELFLGQCGCTSPHHPEMCLRSTICLCVIKQHYYSIP